MSTYGLVFVWLLLYTGWANGNVLLCMLVSSLCFALNV